MSKTILFVAVFTKNSTNVSQSRGFKQNGYKVLEYDYRDRLRALGSVKKRDQELINLCKKESPDYMVFSKCNNMSHIVVKECNKYTKTAMWYMDALHNFNSELKDKIRLCNYSFCGLEGVLSFSKKINKNSYFINQCPDDEYNFLIPNTDKKYDCTFIGNIGGKIHNDRHTYKRECEFKHFKGVYGLEHNLIVNASKINLNFSPTDSSGASVRIYKILASGGFLMSTPWCNMENTFLKNKHFVSFESPKELNDKIKYYLSNYKEAEEIAAFGHKEVQKYMPKNWAKNIIDIMG